VRRLRRTGPSSSRRVPSRARWRSSHEAARINLSISIWQSISSPSHTTSTPSPLSITPPRCSHPNTNVISPPPLHLSHLDWFSLIWTILLATFNSISHLFTSRVMQYHSTFRATYPNTLQSHNLSTALYHGTFIISIPHCPLMSCFASLAAVIEEMILVPRTESNKWSYRRRKMQDRCRVGPETGIGWGSGESSTIETVPVN